MILLSLPPQILYTVVQQSPCRPMLILPEIRLNMTRERIGDDPTVILLVCHANYKKKKILHFQKFIHI